MDINILRAMVKRLSPVQSVTVKFNDGMAGIRLLSIMNAYNVMDMPIMASEIYVNQDWAQTGREMGARLSRQLLDMPDFASFAERGIESVTVASESPLHALQSKREKLRNEAYLKIFNEVYTKSFGVEARDFGLFVQADLVVGGDFFHTIEFTVFNPTGKFEVLSLLTLDGWSGNILDADGKVVCFCPNLDTARVQLKIAFELYLESATSTA